MATIQVTTLKALLKEVGITDRNGKTPSVRVERKRKVDRGIRTIVYYEYGAANCVLNSELVSDKQIAELKALNGHVKVHRVASFTIISY